MRSSLLLQLSDERPSPQKWILTPKPTKHTKTHKTTKQNKKFLNVASIFSSNF
jgi:hypothetical protein